MSTHASSPALAIMVWECLFLWERATPPILIPQSTGIDLLWSLGGKICRVEQMLWHVSRVSSGPRQKQES